MVVIQKETSQKAWVEESLSRVGKPLEAEK